MRYWLLILVALLQIGAAPAPPKDAGRPQDISLIALIANPAAHDGVHVRVTGFLNLEFEANGLYIDRAAFDTMQTRNAVWLEAPDWLDDEARRSMTHRYVVVEGRFNATNAGHMGLYSGALEEIGRLDTLPSRADLEAELRLSPSWLWLAGLGLSGVIVGAIAWLRRRPGGRASDA